MAMISGKTGIVAAGILTAAMVAGVVLAQPGTVGGAQKPASEPAAQARADALEPFRRLAGKWRGAGKEGDPHAGMEVHYRVTSGGSAVVETLFPGTEHEMVTVYFLNDEEVWMTHYCLMRNQPTLKGDFTLDGKSCSFSLVSATNCDTKTGTCMGRADFTFVDADNLRTRWFTLVKGEVSEHVEFVLTRQK